MTMSNIGELSPSGVYSPRAKQSVENKPEGGKKTVDDVLASLREMMPGWTISTSTADWGEGFRNIQIDREILQEMADDPRAMEKYKSLILDLEKTAPELEKWGQENPGQSLELGILIDANGNISAMAVIKSLMGVEKRTIFDLPDDRSSWADIIREKLEALNLGQVEDEFGSRSWIA